MSLSAFLVPVAIGVLGTTIGKNKKIPVDIINDEKQLEELRHRVMAEETNFYKIETPIKKEDILIEALQNYGNKVEETETSIETVVLETSITFIKEETGLYSAAFNDDIKMEDAAEFVESIVDEYTNIVQQQVYEKLMSRAEQEGLVFESEEQREDSVVLTFGVKG